MPASLTDHPDGCTVCRSQRNPHLREATSFYVEANEGFATIDPGEPLPPPRNGDHWLQLVTVACPECNAEPGEACTYLHRGRVRIVTAGGGHRKRKAAAARALRVS